MPPSSVVAALVLLLPEQISDVASAAALMQRVVESDTFANAVLETVVLVAEPRLQPARLSGCNQ
jgi:hypothetical protein